MCIYIYLESKHIYNMICVYIIHIAMKYIKIFKVLGCSVLGLLHMLKGKIFHYLTSKAYTLVSLQLFEIIQKYLCGKVYHGEKDSTLIFIVKKLRKRWIWHIIPCHDSMSRGSVQQKYETSHFGNKLS